MAELSEGSGSQRRRSARLTSPLQANASQNASDKMALSTVAVKRSITVRKIAPRKTVAPSDENKENTPRRSEGGQQKKAKVSTPENVTSHGRSSSTKEKKTVMPSPILPSTPPPVAPSQQPAVDPDDAVWSQKVRRSYSRLSEKSLNSPNSRETLFGFDSLQTPEVVRPAGRCNLGLETSQSGLNSFSSLLEAEDCGSTFSEVDPNIPGVAALKEKKRRRKVQKMDQSEMDAIAAKMNAEFEEAEDFELTVE